MALVPPTGRVLDTPGDVDVARVSSLTPAHEVRFPICETTIGCLPLAEHPLPLTLEFIRLKSYVGTQSSGSVSIQGMDVEAIRGKVLSNSIIVLLSWFFCSRICLICVLVPVFFVSSLLFDLLFTCGARVPNGDR
jgi:hypothetical protein